MTFLVTFAFGLAVVFCVWMNEDMSLPGSLGYREGTRREQRIARTAMFIGIPLAFAVAVVAQLIVNQVV